MPLTLLGALIAMGLLLAACQPGAAGPGTTAARPTPGAGAPGSQAPAATSAASPAASGGQARIALIVPLSGPWGRQGQLVRAGAEMAADEINQQGGIRALGGAQIALEVADAGDTVEKAANAAQRLLPQGSICCGIGSWLSSFTLAVTEVAERQQIPWVTLSFADGITERGFQYVYQTSAVSSAQAREGLKQVQELASANRCSLTKAALAGDNTAAAVGFFDPLRKQLLPEANIQVVVDETWTPPLPDATGPAQKLRSSRPDVVFFGATSFADASQVLQKTQEFGVRAPFVGSGAWLTVPEYVQNVGADRVEGIIAIVGAHPLRGQEPLVERFKQRTGEPFMIQDSLAGYYHVWLFKEALEKAGTADPRQVNAAMKSLDLTAGPAAETMPGGRVRFDDQGRRIDAIPVLAQWQGGQPYTVFPTNVAVREPRWPAC